MIPEMYVDEPFGQLFKSNKVYMYCMFLKRNQVLAKLVNF